MMIQVASQQVELAAIVEACKRRQLLTQASPGPVFSMIGERFSIGEELWKGFAVLSADALFLIKVHRRNDPVCLPGQASEGNLRLCPRPLLTVRYSELPSALTEDQSWPAALSPDCQVAILLREQADEVRPTPFTTELQFRSECEPVLVTCSDEGASIAAERLRLSGWVKASAITRPVKSNPQRRLTPYAMGGGLLLIVAITTFLIQSEWINSQVAMLLCIPLLAAAAYIVMRWTGTWPTDARDLSAQ